MACHKKMRCSNRQLCCSTQDVDFCHHPSGDFQMCPSSFLSLLSKAALTKKLHSNQVELSYNKIQ